MRDSTRKRPIINRSQFKREINKRTKEAIKFFQIGATQPGWTSYFEKQTRDLEPNEALGVTTPWSHSNFMDLWRSYESVEAISNVSSVGVNGDKFSSDRAETEYLFISMQILDYMLSITVQLELLDRGLTQSKVDKFIEWRLACNYSEVRRREVWEKSVVGNRAIDNLGK